jgi:hypothetical protein
MNSRKIPLKRRYVASGRGKYSIGRNWRKSGLGKTTAKTFRHLIEAVGGAMAGGAVAGPTGAAIGAEMAGSGMYTGGGMYTGSGMYNPGQLHTNALISSRDSTSIIPEFSRTPDDAGTIIMSRREYISDVYAPPFINGEDGALFPFSLQSFNLNPGLEKTFPFLSQIAQNYEEYEFIQMIFTFRSTTTDIGSSTSGQCGSIIMATNYNAAAPPFATKNTMMEYMGAMSCKATESMLHGVECDPAKLSLPANGLYTRANPVITGQDLKTYDHGLFQIAVANAPSTYANQVLGELWISYTVKLRKPKLFTGLGLGISRDIFVGSNYEGISLNPSQDGQKGWFGKEIYRGQQNNIGCKIDIPKLDDSGAEDGFRITFPASFAGYLRISYWIRAKDFPDTTGIGVWWYSGLVTPTSPYTNPVVTGNVQMVNDMYGAYNPWDPSITAPKTSSMVQCHAVDNCAMVILHIRVTTATNGVDNTLWLRPATNDYSGKPIQSQLDISEYNAGFSFRAANLSTSDAPILVDEQGTVANANSFL